MHENIHKLENINNDKLKNVPLLYLRVEKGSSPMNTIHKIPGRFISRPASRIAVWLVAGYSVTVASVYVLL
tara:strand:+ start:289 stop:501 length:213 start_codon:yes stop_codon:yes gene_type:complete